jgi:hypothetical protein
MGLISGAFKTALFATGVVVVQLVYDEYKCNDVFTKLNELQEDIRKRKNLVGTIRETLRSEAKDIMDEARDKVWMAATLKALDKRFEIYFNSIAD